MMYLSLAALLVLIGCAMGSNIFEFEVRDWEDKSVALANYKSAKAILVGKKRRRHS